MNPKITKICDDAYCECDGSTPIMMLMARLPNGLLLPPQRIGDRFYGTSKVNPSTAFEVGIPVKGICIDLYRHALSGSGSAFRGTTERPVISHTQAQGAIYWAEEDGWVYELGEMAGWDVERLLEGIVPSPGGFANAPHLGELECAVGSRIMPSMIRRSAKVFKGRRCLELGEWQTNKNYRQAKSRNFGSAGSQVTA